MSHMCAFMRGEGNGRIHQQHFVSRTSSPRKTFHLNGDKSKLRKNPVGDRSEVVAAVTSARRRSIFVALVRM